MSLDDNKTLIRNLVEAFNNHDLISLTELASPGFTDHKHQLTGLEATRKYLALVYKSFPDFHATIVDIVAEGDKVWILEECTMTHTVEYHGIAPTGKRLTQTFVEIYRIADGKVEEMWAVTDELDFLRELGVIEYKKLPQ
jgi:C-1 hydroxylase